jgi:hypothetical protein
MELQEGFSIPGGHVIEPVVNFKLELGLQGDGSVDVVGPVFCCKHAGKVDMPRGDHLGPVEQLASYFVEAYNMLPSGRALVDIQQACAEEGI